MLLKDEGFKPEYIYDPKGFKNPLTVEFETPDPYIIYSEKDKCYYGIHSGDTFLTLYRSKTLADIFKDEKKVIYEASDKDGTYGDLWAPELYYEDGFWYIYTSTKGGDNPYFWHMICLKSKGENPFDGFGFFCDINPTLRAIDATLLIRKSEKYISFAIFDEGEEKLAIQRLSSHGVPVGDYTVISETDFDWEKAPLFTCPDSHINEGPFFIEKGERLFLIYSANGCMSDEYCLGILEFKGGDILKKENWEKDEVPLFKKGNGNFGPGHAMFFYSPDKSELWVCHHCLERSNPDYSLLLRYCHCQKVFFDKTDFPHLDIPIEKNKLFKAPSGE